MKEYIVPGIINLVPGTITVLTGFSNSRTEPAFLVKRSKIILLAAQDEPNKDIAVKLGIHHNTVSPLENGKHLTYQVSEIKL